MGVGQIYYVMLELMEIQTLNHKNLISFSEELASFDPHFAQIFELYGPPPLWDREKGFATLVYIILEQQVSLASAKACFEKLKAELGEVKPEGLLTLSDAELKIIGFSRQKTSYARYLAEALISKEIDLDSLEYLPDEEVKSELKKLKGIGDWSADVYLLMVLLRIDVMPRGDIALHAAWKDISGSERRPDSDEFLRIAERWKPFRSVAARLLWHYYLSEKKKGKR